MFSADAGKNADVGQIESALGYMERLVAERLADQPAPGTGTIGQGVSVSAGVSHRTGNVFFSRSVSLLSWPQAAKMSRPRGVRTGEA
jgi:hypothetical protein